jgi:hypothetical protein
MNTAARRAPGRATGRNIQLGGTGVILAQRERETSERKTSG